ncbi:DUF4489 domain-containing protein [Vallitalea okinawensis]|uniref:DUF4489 domain-containing protein n=1 Tax=Vallitalea okinawensis TaxID=2078660 RepID=UPI000CFA9BC9|nr:DUF4489 domain-containing protein [Vallitalea okinawensis]
MSNSQYVEYIPYQREKGDILLECGLGSGSKTFTSINDTPFQMARVSLNTSCLDKPRVLFKFSSLVRVERLNSNGTVRLKYELFKTCKGESPFSLGTWNFEKINISDSDFLDVAQESFNFIFCECNNCPDCCDYFVKVTPLEITDVRVTVSDGRMAAMGQSAEGCISHDFQEDYVSEYVKPKETILSCGQGNGSVIFGTEDEPPVRIASVELDTASLCEPTVLIEFSSIISYIHEEVPAESVNFQFQLFRRCGKRSAISLGNWIYNVGAISGEIQTAQGFGFTYCECLSFIGCCEYFVMLTPIEVPTEEQEFAMISNSRMTALAQSSKLESKKLVQPKSEPKRTLLECGSGTGSRTFTSSDDSAFQLAQVTIDTNNLCQPKINIEFSSIVSFERTNFDGQELNALLRYELLRVCEDGIEESQGVWALARIDQDSIQVTESFDFTFCEQTICNRGCCTYFVKVTPIEIEAAEVTVSNGRIAVLVQEGY